MKRLIAAAALITGLAVFAFQTGTAEQTGRPRHRQQGRDRSPACRLAEHGDPSGIATEGADVVPHPFQSGDLVQQAPVGRRALEVADGRIAGVRLAADPPPPGWQDAPRIAVG